MKNTVLNAAYKALAAALVIASSSSAPANAQTRTIIDHHHLVSASMAGGVGLSLRHIPQPQSERALGFNGANTMTGNMNTVVGMYSQTSKQDL